MSVLLDLDDVRRVMLDGMRATSMAPLLDEVGPFIVGGKMLRARLTLAVGAVCQTHRDTLLRIAAAVEMVHSASLLHDNMIDEAGIRRGNPSFWKNKGIPGAILLGDLLVCRSLHMLDGVDSGRLSKLFVRLAVEMCDAAAEQELVTREKPEEWAQFLAIARRKTGSLFAFAATAADSTDEVRAAALLEAGYRLGTAFHLAEKIVEAGSEIDRSRQSIRDCCASSLELLAPWPIVQSAWDGYLQSDFQPELQSLGGRAAGGGSGRSAGSRDAGPALPE